MLNSTYNPQLADSYKAPPYDPYETFKPSKESLREIIKQLKRECHEIIQEKQSIKYFPEWLQDYVFVQLEQQHSTLLKRIREMEWHIAGKPSTGNGIGPAQVLQAKQSPIQLYYSGTLRKTSKGFAGLCFKHEEKTPSLNIYTDKNTWNCFGCGEYGDVIDMVMHIKNLKFHEAVKFILNIQTK